MAIETRTEDDGEKTYTIKEVKITGIYDGSVFDHLFAGQGRKFFDALEEILGPTISKKTSAIIQNVDSRAYEKKDLVKLTGAILNACQLTKLYEKFPRFTYSVIEKGEVVEKYTDAKFRLHPRQDALATQQHTLDSAVQ